MRIAALHSGRANRHSLDSQPDNRRLFLQQPPDCVHRDVPFDYIALHERYVTLPEPRWHIVIGVYCVQLRVQDIIFFDLEAILL